MSSTDLHQTLIQTDVYVLTDALHGDITALQNRKQDLISMILSNEKVVSHDLYDYVGKDVENDLQDHRQQDPSSQRVPQLPERCAFTDFEDQHYTANAKAAREAKKEKKKAKAVEVMVKTTRKQKSMRFVDSDDDLILPPMAVDKIVEDVMNGLSTWLADIENEMSSLKDKLIESLMQAEEKQIEQIEEMFHSYKANIKNLHRHVNNLNATVLAISKGLQKTQMQALKDIVELIQNPGARSTTRDKSASPLVNTSSPLMQGQASLPSSAHLSPLAPISEDNEAARSALPLASTSMSGTRSILNSDPASAAAAGSTLSPDPTAVAIAEATAQSAPPAKSSPPAVNPLFVSPAITATMTSITERGPVPSTTTATATPTTECGWRLS
ncbi:hypothetical protein C0995_002204 [Termitomyces sp. Mi166|nr:hypothetical protein C0995_002204 [Termitomyces sp. Mi166\